MFSRTAKSVVKSLTSCQIHSDGKNFKIAREINQILSKLSKNSTKLNDLSLYNVAAVNKPLLNCNGMYNFYDNQLFHILPESLTTKSCSAEVNQPNARKINDNINLNLSNHQEDNGRSQTEKLVEALYRLPIAEEVSALNSPLMPSEKIISKREASNACSRMYPYARILNEMDHSSMKTWQRDYSTAVIRKWFPDLTCPLFDEYDINFILQPKISKMYRSIKKKEINDSSWNNYQMLSTLNYNKRLAKGLMKKLGNINIDTSGRTEKSTNYWIIPAASLNKKPKLLYEIYNHIKFPSLNFINHKSKNTHEIVASNSNNKRTMSDMLNIIEKENWIQQIFFKIKSIFADLNAKMLSYSTATLDLCCSENTFVPNEKIQVSDISNNIILFTSKEDCESKASFQKKIKAFCAQQKKSLKKKTDKDDICKKRERSCTTSERKCQKREKMYGKKEIDCSKGKRTCKEQIVVSCKRRKSSCDKEDVRDCRKTRKVKPQEDRCKQRKNDNSKTKEDLCKRQHYMKQEQTSHKPQEKDLCKKDKKKEIEKPDCSETKKIKPCEEKEKADTSKITEDLCKKEKKEEKPDCSEIKKVKPCDKKECPPVKKAPGCPENEKTKKNDKGC